MFERFADRAANERTLLAWARTAFAMIALGGAGVVLLAVSAWRFYALERALAAPPPARPPMASLATSLLLAIGVFAVFAAVT